jgi:pimeloyl-ACP methyl ester carboxylesterase
MLQLPRASFGEFFALLQESMRPRTEKLPIFEDAALRMLTMPVLAIVGGKDALLDSADTRRRIEALVPNGEVNYLEEAGHFIPGQGGVIAEFLQRGVIAGREREADSAVQAGA